MCFIMSREVKPLEVKVVVYLYVNKNNILFYDNTLIHIHTDTHTQTCILTHTHAHTHTHP